MAQRLFGPISTLVESRSLRDLPVLVHVVSQRARVLRLRRANLPLAIARQAVLPSRLGRPSASLVPSLLEAQKPGPPIPLSTLRLTPRGVNRKTQGQDGVRSLLSYRALSSPSRVEDWRGPLRRPSPIPATSNPACGFPALGLLACFASRVMWPIRSGALS